MKLSQERLIEIANIAGFQTGSINYSTGGGTFPFVKTRSDNSIVELIRFAELVIAEVDQKIEVKP